MRYNQSEPYWGKRTSTGAFVATVCDISVQLVFASQKSGDIPQIVGEILKSAYLQHQGV